MSEQAQTVCACGCCDASGLSPGANTTFEDRHGAWIWRPDPARGYFMKYCGWCGDALLPDRTVARVLRVRAEEARQEVPG